MWSLWLAKGEVDIESTEAELKPELKRYGWALL